METVAVAGLVGLGYLVSRLASNNKSEDYGMFKTGSKTVARRGPVESFVNQTPQGASPVRHNPDPTKYTHSISLWNASWIWNSATPINK